jgi:hypothetical protein
MPAAQPRNCSGVALSTSIAAAARPWCRSSSASKNSLKRMVDRARPGVASASTMSSQAVLAVSSPRRPYTVAAA